MTKLQESAVVASYMVSYELARAKKPFTDGEIVKRCSLRMAEAFKEDKVVKEFQSVPLSKQTVTRRIEDISTHLSTNLKSVIEYCPYFSLALDESCDITDTSQLLVFVKLIRDDFTIIEELLNVCSLRGTTKGQDIFSAVQTAVEEYGGFDKLTAVVTDGAKAMVGSNTGFIGLLKQKQGNVPAFHCIVHQEALCAKSIKLCDTMATVTKITNIIRGGNKSLTHRKFISFLEELDTAYGDLLLHTEIRWLSRGKCLIRFYELRHEILSFLQQHVPSSVDLQHKLTDIDFLQDLAFLTDITQYLNVLNLQLQGKKQTIFQMMGFVDGFKRKLRLFKSALTKNELFHFPSCEKLSREEDVLFDKYTEHIELLISEFDRRFQDFEKLRPEMELFNNPMKCTVESQPAQLQLELCELQCDPSLNNTEATGVEFWRLLSQERYPLLRIWALKLCSIFGSTYICEVAFSAMKLIKSKTRSRMTDSVLSHALRVATSEMEVDFKSILQNFAKPQCSH